MNRYLIIFFISFNIFSQESKKEFYVDSNQDYCLLIEKTTSVTKKNVEGVDMDVFLNLKEKTFNYTTVISKISNHNFMNGNLLDESYEKFIKENCNCEIIDSEIVLYNNLKSLRYKIKTQKDKNIFIGYIDSFVSNTLLYNVVFMAFQNNFDNVKAEYINSMNTLIINGKTTIDSDNP